MASKLGALLDPLANKALLVSIYMALGSGARYRADCDPRGLAATS